MTLNKLLLVLACAAPLPLAAEDGAPNWDVSPSNKADRFEIAREKGWTVLRIYSKRGIGSALVRKKRSDVGKGLLIRLFYGEGERYMRLEGFKVVATKDGKKVYASLHRPEEEKPGARKNAAGRVKKVGDAVEVELWGKWVSEHPEFTITWIDFYRD